MNVKVAYIKATGAILGYYPENIEYKEIPEPFVIISGMDHANILMDHRPYAVVEGQVVPVDVPVYDPHNDDIKAQLADIDKKKIRAITDAIINGDRAKLEALEAHAIALRAQLR